MPSTLSPQAKAKVAAAAAVALAAITAWQGVTADGFTLIDLVPVVAVTAAAMATDLIPNTPGQPKAKAIAHWALSAVAAVASAVAAFAATDPAGATAVKLLTVAAGAFLVWYVPELAPAVAPIEHTGRVTAADVAAIAVELAPGEHADGMTPDLPVQPAPPVDEQADIVTALHAFDAAPPDAPTPTYDQVAADLATPAVVAAPAAAIPVPAAPLTRPMAAVTAGTPAPTA